MCRKYASLAKCRLLSGHPAFVEAVRTDYDWFMPGTARSFSLLLQNPCVTRMISTVHAHRRFAACCTSNTIAAGYSSSTVGMTVCSEVLAACNVYVTG